MLIPAQIVYDIKHHAKAIAPFPAELDFKISLGRKCLQKVGSDIKNIQENIEEVNV